MYRKNWSENDEEECPLTDCLHLLSSHAHSPQECIQDDKPLALAHPMGEGSGT